ncbi:25121_t:CDS:2, partial [Gigaspora rosea]
VEQADRIQIVPAIYITSDRNVEEFVKVYYCLDNDDLVMVTALGVLIWTFNTKVNKIELNYFWDDENDTWDWDRIKVIKLFYEIDEENFDEKKFDIKKLKKTSYFLPPSSYIKKHINDKFFIILYGQKLFEEIIKEDEETLLRKLLNGCIEQIENDEETLNTQIFEIFSQSIFDIYKKVPSFVDDFVIQISLLCILK